MRSLILSAATRLLLPLMMVYSVFLLIRGHNEPGGGFVGGLVAASAIALYMFSEGLAPARQTLRIDPIYLVGAGLLSAFASGILGAFLGRPFLTALWWDKKIPVLLKLGTPLLFDIGVYLVVIGVVLTMVFSLSDD
jgi:multicomponent Na+:H+ antiporter subunit B